MHVTDSSERPGPAASQAAAAAVPPAGFPEGTRRRAGKPVGPPLSPETQAVQARLKFLFRREPRRLTAIAAEVGIHPDTARRYLRRTSPSIEFVMAVEHAFRVPFDWLLRGQGPGPAGGQEGEREGGRESAIEAARSEPAPGSSAPDVRITTPGLSTPRRTEPA